MHGQDIQALITNVSGTAGVFHESKGLYAGTPNVAANAYVVTAAWTEPKTNTVYTFEKRCMADQPPPYKEGQTILVRIAPDDPVRYAMDIEC